MVQLFFLENISPLLCQLQSLVSRVGVVEDSEFGSKHECKMSIFNKSYKEGKVEVMGVKHTHEPFVVEVATHPGDEDDSRQIGSSKQYNSP